MRQAETWLELAEVNGRPSQPSQRPAGSRPGQPGHQVELAGPGVAQLDRVGLHAVRAQHQVPGAEPLPGPVVQGGADPGRVRGEPVHPDPLLTAVVQGQVGDEGFHDEGAAGHQAGGHAGEAADLFLLGQQHEEGVEHHVHQPVRPARRRQSGEVPDRHGQVGPAWLGPQLGHHPFRRVDAVHPQPARGQRQRDPAGPDTQLEHGPVPRRRPTGQELHHRTHVVAFAVPLVVHVGDAVPVLRSAATIGHRIHGPSLPVPERE